MDLANPDFADTRHRKFLCTLSDALCDTDADVGIDPSHGQPRKDRTGCLFAADGHGRLLRSSLPVLVPFPRKNSRKEKMLNERYTCFVGGDCPGRRNLVARAETWYGAANYGCGRRRKRRRAAL